jgi:hypothetical protein
MGPPNLHHIPKLKFSGHEQINTKRRTMLNPNIVAVLLFIEGNFQLVHEN